VVRIPECSRCSEPSVAILYHPHELDASRFCELHVDWALRRGWMDLVALETLQDNTPSF